jgi:hypothetical protein
MKSIFILTASYPYDSSCEATFLDLEMLELVRVASQVGVDVTFFPQSCSGDIQAPNEVLRYCKIDLSVSRRLRSKYNVCCDLVFVLFSSRVWKGVVKVFSSNLTLRNLLSWERRRRAIYSVLSNKVSCLTIAYSYWFDCSASAISRLRSENKILKSVSRAHGWDLYEERFVHPYRDVDLNGIDGLYCVSKYGMNYLKNMFFDYADRIFCSYLGTALGRHVSVNFKCIEFVSCSYVVPVKRVNLIAESVIVVAKKNRSSRFKWTHFGGVVDKSLIDLASCCPENIDIHFAGDVDNKDIISYYMSGVHLFINLSVSEGLPVSIMEA